MRYLSAGETHGKGILALLDGFPAGLAVSCAQIDAELKRRQGGYGRGGRQQIESDRVEFFTGLWQGKTTGAPLALWVANKDYKIDEMPELDAPRPGHADLSGALKYEQPIRPVLERASARSTATRVAIGVVAKQFLAQALGISVLSHVVQLGHVEAAHEELPRMVDLPRIDADPVRCDDAVASAKMVMAIDEAKADGDTLGGIVEVVAWNCPPGLGSYTQPDRRLDARLAGALMGVQAIKGVEVGAGMELAWACGSQAHDELAPCDGGIQRLGNKAGGIEGGMSNGSPIWLHAAMKPIPTVPRALATVDIATGEATTAHHQRSDVTAVPAAGVIAEAEVALVLADAVLEKFGGDSLEETARNAAAYAKQVRERGLAVLW